MRVVVTGGAGKMGQWVVRELLEASEGRTPHKVVVFDQLTAPGLEGVQQFVGEIQDLGQVFEGVAGADVVIHLAAIRRAGITTDDVTFRTNVLGTFNVHEAAYRLGVRRVVTASSQAILGWDYRERDFLPDYLPVDENHPVRPQDAYGLSKECSEAIARSYARRGLETIVLRPNWVITPDELERLRAARGRQPDGFRLYSYLDARDMARAVRLAAERPITSGEVLFLVADDTAVAAPLCELLPRLMPELGEMARELTGSRPAISNDRAKSVLGWQPRHSWRSSAMPRRGSA